MNSLSSFPPACWIWPDYPGDDLINAWVQFRQTFQLEAPPSRAIVHVTADTRYRLYVNGRRVLDGPVRGFQEHWFYDTVDLTPYLRPGRNVIAALAHNLGIGTHAYIHEGFGGFLLWSSEGPELRTDGTWRTRRSPEHLRHLTRTSIQTGWQEFVDATRGDGDWTSPEYDDSSWTVPPPRDHGIRPAGAPPWHGLAPRDIPPLREAIFAPARLVSVATWADAGPPARAATNVVTSFVAAPWEWRRVDRAWTDERVSLPGDPARAQAWCFDFGREALATTLLEIEGARGGEVFDCLMTEGCDGATPVFHPDVGCKMQFGHRYVARAGDQNHESFQAWGYRYLVVVVHGAAEGLRFRVRVRHTEYPLERRGFFDSSHAALTRIYELCAHTQQLCMSDAYVDCPGREQAMWWGDAHCHFDNSQRLGADDRLLVRGLRLIARQTLPNGLTYSHAPTKAHECVLPDFTLMWIETHWQHWWFSGSTALFEEHCPKILRALDYFAEQAEASGGLLRNDRRYWLFLDWAEVFRDGAPTLYNLQYLRTLELAADLLQRVGRPEARDLRERADRLRALVASQLWDADRRLPLDGLDWDGRPAPACTLHARVMAIRAGLWPEYHEEWIQRDLTPFVRGPRPRGDKLYTVPDPHADRGALTPYFMQFLFSILTKAGRGADVLDCIARWWGSMLERGLVTTEEVWDAQPGVASLCHAWTAHPLQFLSTLELGLTQTAPGWTEVEFAPVFFGRAARGAIDTPLGPIRVEWRREAESVDVRLQLPPGCRAQIAIPGAPPELVSGAWSARTPLNRERLAAPSISP